MGMLLHRRRVDVNATTMADTTPKATEEVKVAPQEIGEHSYSRTDIAQMSTSDLKKLAEELGLDSELSGAKLKVEIKNKLGL